VLNPHRYLWIAMAIAVPHLQCQSLLDQVNFKSGTLGGLRLYGASVYSGYSSSAYPLSGGLPSASTSSLQAVGPDVNYGVSASLGWQHHRDRTIFSLLYTGSYSGMAHYSDLNGFSQSLSFSASRQLSSKWTVSFSGSGQDSTLIQFLNQPSSLSIVSRLPLSFDDLAAAFAIGQFSNSQMASALTGAPLFESPSRNLLAGRRILSYSGQTALSYAHSSRLSVQLSGFSAAGQSRDDGSGGAPQNQATPRSAGLTAGIGLSYSLSPRTQAGLSANETYIVNKYQRAYLTSGTASIGRKMGQHWFLNVYGGGSITRMRQQSYGTPASQQPIGGGSIGFRTYQHTFVGSYTRSGSDNYGFAAGTNTTASGSWTWRRPGSRWSTFASAGQQNSRNNGFASLSGWTVSGGLTASLTTQTSVTAQYVYASNRGTYVGAPHDLTIHSFRVSLGWSPGVMH
jgi:hypothetical protein